MSRFPDVPLLPRIAAVVHAMLVVMLWVPWFLGLPHPPSALSADDWLVHEMTTGVGALLLAAPAWPSARGRSAILLAVWLAGRLVVSAWPEAGPWALAAGGTAFPIAMMGLRPRPSTGAPLALLSLGAAVFQWEVWRYGSPEVAPWLMLAAVIVPLAMRVRPVVPMVVFVALGVVLVLADFLAMGSGTGQAAMQAVLLGGLGQATLAQVIGTRRWPYWSATGLAAASTTAVITGSLVSPAVVSASIIAWSCWTVGFLAAALTLAADARRPRRQTTPEVGFS